jgi:hypothetical protein
MAAAGPVALRSKPTPVRSWCQDPLEPPCPHGYHHHRVHLRHCGCGLLQCALLVQWLLLLWGPCAYTTSWQYGLVQGMLVRCPSLISWPVVCCLCAGCAAVHAAEHALPTPVGSCVSSSPGTRWPVLGGPSTPGKGAQQVSPGTYLASPAAVFSACYCLPLCSMCCICDCLHTMVGHNPAACCTERPAMTYSVGCGV